MFERIHDDPQADRNGTFWMPAVGEFMRHLAHELGNPVAAIKMSSEMLQGELPADVREQLSEIVAEETLRLEMLIERAVFLTNIGNPSTQPNEVLATMHAAVDQARDHGGQVPLGEVSAPEDGSINADSGMIVRLVRELIENAVQAGAERVDLEARRGDGAWSVIVKDDGEGVDNAALRRIFEPFYTTRDGRLGVGLNIARRIAELHGGTLSVTSGSPRGAVVEINLPDQTTNESQSTG